MTINAALTPLVFLNTTSTNKASGFITQESGTSKWAIGSNFGSGDGTFNLYNYGAAARYLTITTTGNVGIATDTPTAKLQIAVASAVVDGTKGVRITNPAGTIVMLECGSVSDSFVGTTSGSDFHIRTNNINRLSISSSGAATFSSSVATQGELSVGFGTLSSDRMMQISGSSFTSGSTQFAAVVNPTFGNSITNLYGLYISLASGTSVTNRYHLFVDGAGGGTATNDYSIYVANTAKSYFAGNVGIGTSSPSEKLHISATTGNVASLVETVSGAFAQYQLKGGATDVWLIGTQDNYLSNSLVFRNVSDRMVITTGGNVIIGTTDTSTGHRLTVYSATETAQFRAAGAAPAILFTNTATNTNSYSGYLGMATAANNFVSGAAAGDFVLHNYSGGPILLGINNVEKVRVTSTTTTFETIVKIPTQPTFSVKNGAAITITSTDTVLPFDTEYFDIGSNYNTSNYRFTAPYTGKYLMTFEASMTSGGAHTYNAIYIEKNGAGTTFRFRGPSNIASGGWFGISVSVVIDLTAGDYLQLNGYTDSSTISVVSTEGCWSGYYLG